MGNDVILCLLRVNIVEINNYWPLFRGSNVADSGGANSENCWLTRYDSITIIVVQIDNAIKA